MKRYPAGAALPPQRASTAKCRKIDPRSFAYERSAVRASVAQWINRSAQCYKKRMWLIVGLGNPGEEYARTRHNIGFICLKGLAGRHGLDFSGKRAQARIAEGTLAGQRVALAKPFTYMNLSGQAVSGLRSWYKIDPARELLVIYDDMDLPFGKLRIRERGSPGTHNGMRSIVGQLGNGDFPRLRVGIGQPQPGRDAVGYVLGRFSKEEEAALPEIAGRVADAVELIVREGVTAAMNRYNAEK